MSATPVGNEGALNGTTPVTVLAAPGAATQRVVAGLSFHNRDTAVVTLTIRKLKGASTYVLMVTDLDVGDTLEIDKRIVLDATDESITALLSAAPATTNPNFDAAAIDYA